MAYSQDGSTRIDYKLIMYVSNLGVWSSSMSSDYEEMSVYRPTSEDESFWIEKSSEEDGESFRVEYYIHRIYKREGELKLDRFSSRRNQSSFDNTSQRNHFKVVLIKNTTIVHQYLKQAQARDTMKRVVSINHLNYVRPNLILKVERMQYDLPEYIKTNPSPAVVVQLIVQFIEGLNELEAVHLFDLDRHIKNFMVRVQGGRVVGKHMDFELCILLHPKASSQIRYYNMQILKNRNYQDIYAKFGRSLIDLVNRIHQHYDQLINNRDELRKIHTIQLHKFVRDLYLEIRPLTLTNKHLTSITDILNSYAELDPRQKLIEKLQATLPLEIGNDLSFANNPERTFKRQQLRGFFRQNDFINDPFYHEEQMDKYFVRPIMESQSGMKLSLQENERRNIALIVQAIEEHLQQESNDHPQLFRRLAHLLRMQLNWEQPIQNPTKKEQILPILPKQLILPDPLFASTNEEQIIGPIPQQQQEHSISIENSYITFYSPVRAEQSMAENSPRAEVNRISSEDDDGRGLLEGLQDIKDRQLFFDFIILDPPELPQLRKHPENEDKFKKLHAYLCEKGFNQEQLHIEISRIKFAAYRKEIQKLQYKIKAKYMEAGRELMRRGEVIDLLNSDYLQGVIEEKCLGVVVEDYFNMLPAQHKSKLASMREAGQYVLNKQDEETFFKRVDQLYEHEDCEVFRSFIKQHIIHMFTDAEKYLRPSQGLRASPIKSQKSEKKNERARPQFSQDHDRTRVEPLVNYKYIDNSQQIIEQNFFFNGEEAPEVIEVEVRDRRHDSFSSEDPEDSDDSQ